VEENNEKEIAEYRRSIRGYAKIAAVSGAIALVSGLVWISLGDRLSPEALAVVGMVGCFGGGLVAVLCLLGVLICACGLWWRTAPCVQRLPKITRTRILAALGLIVCSIAAVVCLVYGIRAELGGQGHLFGWMGLHKIGPVKPAEGWGAGFTVSVFGIVSFAIFLRYARDIH
jgi:hypothetical protein